MLRRLPPLNALKAFEAAARHESFTRAAEELCVTQGAVSHQVKALEAALGLKLFNRERQRLRITEAGRDYLAVALARTTLAAWDLINGRLVRPFAVAPKLSKTYWIVCAKATATLPKIATFRDWLLAEAAEDERRLKKLA
jgi:DNA-binding transcriptional LysR family regulator